jgi:hypothetical protein
MEEKSNIDKDIMMNRPHVVERVIEDSDGIARRVKVNLAESPLAWLRAREMVSHRQFAAGELLRADCERAGLGARVTMSWDMAAAPARGRRGAPAPVEPGLAGLAARDRLNGALAEAGPGLRDILWRVVCACEGMAAAESALGWPARAGKLVLGFGLDRVANYYRLR